MSNDNILTELAAGDYYEVVRQRLPWIESTIPESRKVVEMMRRSPAYIETTVKLLEEIWNAKHTPAKLSDHREIRVNILALDQQYYRACGQAVSITPEMIYWLNARGISDADIARQTNRTENVIAALRLGQVPVCAATFQTLSVMMEIEEGKER